MTAVAGVLASTPATAQSPAAAPLTAKVRTAVLDSVRAILRRTYVDADTGRQIAAYLAQRERAHAYDSLTDATRFAQDVRRDLQAINRDKHLTLMLQPPGMQRVAVADDNAMTQMAQMARRGNFGLRKVEILDGNVGYLEVTGFDDAPGAYAAIGDALRFLERTDAIIIDVRRNGGGSGEMSHMLFSHFLGQTPVPTIRVRDRSAGEDTTLTSVAAVTGPRRTTVPLYVLTSGFSASAAEEFAFVLKNQKRATIVGARTAGAGHMNQIIDVGHGFAFSVSYTRVSDPVTGKEWEQVGVAPDIETPAPDALEAARQHALQRMPRGPLTSRPPG